MDGIIIETYLREMQSDGIGLHWIELTQDRVQQSE